MYFFKEFLVYGICSNLLIELANRKIGWYER